MPYSRWIRNKRQKTHHNHRKLSFCLMALVIIPFLSACNSEPETGGPCDYVEIESLARVKQEGDGVVYLLNAQDELIDVPAKLFSDDVARSSLYRVKMQKLIKGACTPYSVTQVEPVAHPGVQVSPEDGQIYMAAFVLAGLAQCEASDNPEGCLATRAPQADPELLQKVFRSEFRKTNQCQVAVIESLWSKLPQSSADKQILVCVNDSHNKTLPVLMADVGEDTPRYEVMSIYDAVLPE